MQLSTTVNLANMMVEKDFLFHEPVLPKQLLSYCKPEFKTAVDFTIGYGGHAKTLLQQFPHLRLLGVDQDAAAIQACSLQLKPFSANLDLMHQNFVLAAQDLKLQDKKFNFAYADLGISSPQVDNPSRGFSFNKLGPLDMRMNTKNPQTAEQVVNEYSKLELQKLLYTYGEEKFAPKIATAIVKTRAIKPFKTTLELAELVFAVIPRRLHKKRIHPATKTFQAIRIEVNQEQQQLKEWLNEVLGLLHTGGRLAVIAFHSLEDRLVKHCFFDWAHPCTCPKQFALCHCGKQPLVKLLTKKVVRPEPDEVSMNPRSRSARLRVLEKI